MSSPNPNPEDHGEEILGRSDGALAREAEVLAAMSEDLADTRAAELATHFEPVVPDGGAIGRKATPQRLARVSHVRASLRLWAPGLLVTAVVVAVLVSVELPGPLAVYAVGLAGFAWWVCAGRPGPAESVRLAIYTAIDFGAWIKRHATAWTARRSRGPRTAVGTESA
ncbi:hypothetical protein [Nocardia brasiliensis]|uniref:hypothetical protein n=1 Tax=Nocardia brasiliensis TaxID=37326 RepID=UPI0024586441|nr:hypothetical protein [Nocardia brasiliensis]